MAEKDEKDKKSKAVDKPKAKVAKSATGKDSKSRKRAKPKAKVAKKSAAMKHFRFSVIKGDAESIGSYRIQKGSYRDFAEPVAKALMKSPIIDTLIKSKTLKVTEVK